MMTLFDKILYGTAVFIAVLPVFVSIFSKAFNAQIKALILYFVISLLHELLSNFSESFNIPSADQLSMHIYTILEALLILYIYFKELKLKNPWPVIILGAAFTTIALSLISHTDYNGPSNTIEAIIILPFTISYLYKSSDDINILKLTDHYFFWINAAFLFYFSLTFLIFLFSTYVRTPTNFHLWNIHSFANIIYNILLTIGLWKTRTYRP